jgi:hypothetical protein
MRPNLRALFLLVLAGGTLLLGESNTFAQTYYYGPPPPPRYYRPAYAAPYRPVYAAPYRPYSHEGLFLRVTGGLGYLAASESSGGTTLSYSGFGFSFAGAIGGAVAPNLIIFGEVLGTTAFNADQTYGGVSQGLSGLDVTLLGVGPGVAYYIEPANVYLSSTLAFSTVSFTDTSSQYTVSDTNWGVGASFTVGKQWWIGGRWGFGFAGQVHLASMTDPQSNSRLEAIAISGLASLTLD